MTGEARARCEQTCLHLDPDPATRDELADLLAVAAALCGAAVALATREGDGSAVAAVGVASDSLAALAAAVAGRDPAATATDVEVPGGLRLVGSAPLLTGDAVRVGGLWVFGSAGEAGERREALARVGRRIVAGFERARAARKLEEREALLRGAINGAPMVVFLLDGEGRFTLSEGGGLVNLGLRPGQVVGMSAYELYASFPTIVDNLRAVVAGGEREWMGDLGTSVYETRARPLRGPDGALIGTIGVAIDVTERTRMEAEHRRLQDEVMQAQATALAELSTPLIPIAGDVVVLPLIGTIDANRSQSVLEALLEGITRTRARVALIDVTGAARLDLAAAEGLLRAARAVRLLGAECVLTGIRPEAAQVLVGLGLDLGDLVTRGTLEGGIAWAMDRRR